VLISLAARCTCRQQSKGRKGSIKLKYSLSDGGPVAKPLPGWVPQLQMHMLATGCQSVLLVSRWGRALLLYTFKAAAAMEAFS
jgi:hypothetical protein